MANLSNNLKNSSNISFFSRIRFKLTVIMIVIGIIPIIGLDIASYNKAYNVLEDKLKLTSQQTLGEVNRGLNNYFNALSRNIEMLSNNVNFTALNIHPEYEPFSLGLMKDVKESNPAIKSIYFGMPSKKMMIYPDYTYASDYDPTKTPWYELAVNNKGKIMFSKPFKDVSSETLVVSISKAVFNNDDFVGVISMSVDLENLSKQFSDVKIGREGYLYITDAEGIMLAHPDKTLIGTDEATKISAWKDISTNKAGFEDYIFDGASKLACYTTNELTGWKLISSLNESELFHDTDAIEYMMLVVAIIILIVTSLAAYLISSFISKNINKIQASVKSASEGNLTKEVNIKSKDEFGYLAVAFNNMLKDISSLIKEVKTSADVISKTSETISEMSSETTTAVSEVSVTMDQVSNGTIEQSRSIENGVAEIESLANKIEMITKLTEEMTKISTSTNKLTKTGLNIIDYLTDKSNKTSEASKKVGQVVYDMSSSTEEIEIMTNIINDIASRTNLLALNAAIEAARAGEAGRGFSVVAEEIRKLAEQSTESTKRIQDLINNIKDRSALAVEAVESTKTFVTEQEKVVNETKRTFSHILSSIENMLTQIASVQQSIYEINSSKDEIVEKMQSISTVSEETSASTQEVSATAEEVTVAMTEFKNYASHLNQLSADLEKTVSKFNTL